MREERIERELRRQGFDTQSDEGARELQRRFEREDERRSLFVDGLFVKPSDLKAAVKFRGISI